MRKGQIEKGSEKEAPDQAMKYLGRFISAIPTVERIVDQSIASSS